jgi:sulfopyruvate decarboxylase TPP-binding subunit
MITGTDLVATLRDAGITDVPWLPDSEIGRWEEALSSSTTPRLIRVCREGEALAIAAGLLIGVNNPLAMIQCTGLFEAGDALRNVVHDLGLPLRVLVGVRNWLALQKQATVDTCPRFTVPIVEAWGIPYRWLDGTAADLAAALREPGPRIYLLPE